MGYFYILVRFIMPSVDLCSVFALEGVGGSITSGGTGCPCHRPDLNLTHLAQHWAKIG